MRYDEQDQYIRKLRKLEAENTWLRKAFHAADAARKKAVKLGIEAAKRAAQYEAEVRARPEQADTTRNNLLAN